MGVDLAIVGSGSAAFAAAISASRSGRSVAIVERGSVGGTCVNTGCVPSKALLAAGQALHDTHVARRFPGIAATPGPVHFGALIAGKDALVSQLRAEKYVDLATDYGVEVIAGTARFAPGPIVNVDLNGGGQREIEAAAYLVASGAAPWIPPIRGLDQTGYLTSTTAMELGELPESLLVIGGNAIGLEQAQLFARLGTRVTIVEARDRLAPFEEPEISALIAQALADEGITIHTSSTVQRVQRFDGHIAASVSGPDRATTDIRTQRVLVAAGRLPNTAGLELDSIGVTLGDQRQIVVDEYQRTTNQQIWAAGDVTGGPQYVYVAAAQGKLAADNAFGQDLGSIDYAALPRVTFTSPAIASAGITQAQAHDAGIAVESRVLPLEHVPRAIVNRDTRGFVKLVAEAGTGRLLGAHVAADGAGEIIAAAVIALQSQLSVSELANIWSPYLTMTEALKLAAQTFTTDVTKLSCCAA